MVKILPGLTLLVFWANKLTLGKVYGQKLQANTIQNLPFQPLRKVELQN